MFPIKREVNLAWCWTLWVCPKPVMK